MNAQDALAAFAVRQSHHNLTIESAGTQQCRIEHVGAIGRGQDDHVQVRIETIEFT